MGWNKGKGRGIQFLRDLIGHEGDECVIWPFSRVQNGYGNLGFEGKIYIASNLMCKLAHGEPPAPDYEAAHSCGNGDGGCVNPKHLSWKTPSDNARDCRAHGTQARNPHGSGGRLQPIEVEQIRALEGTTTQREIAARFGISDRTVRDIFRGWSHGPNRKITGFSRDDDATIRQGYESGIPIAKIAATLGRSYGSVSCRASRIKVTTPRSAERNGTRE